MTAYFWQSLTGFARYFNQIPLVLGILSLLLLLGLFAYLIRRLSPLGAEPERAGPGCLTQILDILIQTLLLALFILIFLPIFLERSSQLSWQEVEPLGFVAIRSSLLAMIAVTLLSFIPFVGRVLAGSPGLEAFLLATLTFRLMSPLYLEAWVGADANLANFYPGLWDSLAYLLLALILTRLIMVAGFALFKNASGPWKNWAGPLLDILAGLVVFLMYAQGTALRLQTALGPLS